MFREIPFPFKKRIFIPETTPWGKLFFYEPLVAKSGLTKRPQKPFNHERPRCNHPRRFSLENCAQPSFQTKKHRESHRPLNAKRTSKPRRPSRNLLFAAPTTAPIDSRALLPSSSCISPAVLRTSSDIHSRSAGCILLYT